MAKLARAQNEVGKVTLQDVLRAQNEQSRVETEIANLEDSRGPLLAQFKAALGLRADEPAPAIPQRFESTPLELTSEQVFEAALARNTQLKGLEADVRAAEASLNLAYKARMPDVSLGFMADVKMNPTLYRPWGTVAFRMWRDKLAAEVAAGAGQQARGRSAAFGGADRTGGGGRRKGLPIPRGEPQPGTPAETVAPEAAPVSGGGPLRLYRRRRLTSST